MKERPILFSGEMVRAILAGRKTQTRRIVRINPCDGTFYMLDGWPHRSTDGESNRIFGMEERYASPYGIPGDRLWVRETWRTAGIGEAASDGMLYAADYAHRPVDDAAATAWVHAHVKRRGADWRPSIFMPRWASRLSLVVESVRVEQLQDITRADARAEGVETLGEYHDYLDHAGAVGVGSGDAEVKVYASLWDRINGDRATWVSNPYVWVVGFERVTP